MNIILQNIECGDKMQKVDKEGNVTKEYIEFGEKLEREDLEHFYMGADFLNDDLQQRIERAIEYIETDLAHATSNGKLHRKHLLDILKGVDKE